MYQAIWRRVAAGLVVGMIVLNLVVGLLAYRYLGNISANYTRLLNQGIPFLNNMQSVTAQSSRGYGVLIDLSEAETPEDIDRLESELKAIRQTSENIFSASIKAAAVPEELKPAFNDILQTRQQGRAHTERFLELVRAHRLPEARNVLHKEIYVAQKAYLTKLDRFCDDYQKTFASLNRQLIDQNSQSRSLIFSLSAFPAVLLIVGIVLSIVGTISLLIIFAPRFRRLT